MLPKHLFLLIQSGESETLDFKKTITSTRKIAKTMVSFANHKGGKLLVGVNDNKTISGVRSDEEKYMLDMAAGFFCKPPIDIQIKEWETEGKTILEVDVPKGTQAPYMAQDEQGQWWAYVRVKDESILASKVMVDILRRQTTGTPVRMTYSSKEKALLAYLNMHDKITMKELCHFLNIARWRAQRMLVNLVSIGAIRMHLDGKNEFYTL